MSKTGIKRGYTSYDTISALKHRIAKLGEDLATALDELEESQRQTEDYILIAELEDKLEVAMGGLQQAEYEIDYLARAAYSSGSELDALRLKDAKSENPARLARGKIWRIGNV